MQVAFEKIQENIKIKLFSASFQYTIPINLKYATLDIWRHLSDFEAKNITIFLSHITCLPENTNDVELIKKEGDMVSFLSPIRGIPEELESGGKTQIPFQYCQDAFKKITEYLL